MDFENLRVEDLGAIRVISINRPTKLNALNQAVIGELQRAVEGLAGDDAVRAAIVTGVGEKAFVAGADIAEFAELTPDQAQSLARRGQRVLDMVANLGKPVIAAVNGFALGGGCELALACHLRVAATTAKFGQPEVKLGLIPGYGGTQRLARLVGSGRALELLVTGGTIDAQTALAWGLVNRVVEPDALLASAHQLAEQILAVSPAAVARCLQAVRVGLELPLEEAQEWEAALFGLCFATRDAREGIAAFLGKRSPAFTGT